MNEFSKLDGSGRWHGFAAAFGTRVIQSPLLTNRVQFRKPSFRRYPWLRRFQLYRNCRARYIRWVRRRWQEDEANWKDVPSDAVFILPNGDIVMHPALFCKIQSHDKTFMEG